MRRGRRFGSEASGRPGGKGDLATESSPPPGISGGQLRPTSYRSPTISRMVFRIELWLDLADRLLETVASSPDIRAAGH
jgi:hypothetical protein